MNVNDFYIITCEHGGNRVPSRYRDFFRGHEDLLRTHRGYDAGALRVARELANALSAPLVACTVTRLLIELNRSPRHPKLYSEVTRGARADIKHEIVQRYYQPYRAEVESLARQAIGRGMRVVHISSHSFTPELDGEVRNADIGLLYDPARPGEAQLCRRWRGALKHHAAELKTRMNYPYAGTSDGFTVHLRRCFPSESYLGIELEINQKHALEGGTHWRHVRSKVIDALQEALLPENMPVHGAVTAGRHLPA